MNKKLQVFISSTYTDLIDERQATVQAILDAGHIPAGMELFKAGRSQMKTIKKWIDESDVYMLILGGRYGTIEEESGLSYTELEYRYALSKGMPVFAVVLGESFLYTKAASKGAGAIFERDNKDKYDSFKEYVKTKVVKFPENIDQISGIVYSHLNDILNDSENDLAGWIRGDNDHNTLRLLKDNSLLIAENEQLNKKIKELQAQLNCDPKEKLGDFSYSELVSLFKNKVFDIPKEYIYFFKKANINALNLFCLSYDVFAVGITNKKTDSDITKYVYYNIAPYYIGFNLLEIIGSSDSTAQRIQTTKLGNSFYTMLQLKNDK